MNDESSPSREDSAARDIEQTADNNRAQSEGVFDPKVEVLLDQADEILTAEIDPMVREALKADPRSWPSGSR
ncbi:MAG: hypothetical protein QOH71_968 [Blastocatellia bacterium]|jgi:hypothetical protein|nr:hypothetical protein [Blastocatellia bacterium]